MAELLILKFKLHAKKAVEGSTSTRHAPFVLDWSIRDFIAYMKTLILYSIPVQSKNELEDKCMFDCLPGYFLKNITLFPEEKKNNRN